MQAIEALNEADIEKTLWNMYERRPTTLRKLLGLILEPNSILIHRDGIDNPWIRKMGDNKFTESFLEIAKHDVFCNQRFSVGYKKQYVIDLSEIYCDPLIMNGR